MTSGRIFASFLLLGALTLGRAAGVDWDEDDFRLPDHTEPVSYELRVRPDVDPARGAYTFGGQVDIVIRARRYATEVVLNSKDLNVSSVSALRDANADRTVAVTGFECDASTERLIVRLERSIVPRRSYRFTVEFGGALRDDFTGFHKYFYDSSNSSRWIALTEFKPVYARRAFPCYDEPKFKTPYKISIARRVQHFSLSNMPLIYVEINPRSGWAWDHFETTKPIPTYLVAFMVSDFDRNALNDESLAMYTRKEFIEYTSYMMKKAPQLLEGVEKFTQIPYMLPKLDVVGVPLLDAYNMENWGLNSYEEFYVTLSNNSKTDDKILGTMTVLHAILHQWFGNMVTTPWWDYAWLNEGICNYLNYYITDSIEPEWDLYERFIEDVHQRALAWDQYDDVHPLTSSVLTPSEIATGFDAITTDKSAALFRMLKHTVGESNFRTSMNKYLDDFAYAEAKPRDLWNAFDNVLYDNDYTIDDGIAIADSMYLWTEQAGYPMINVATADDGSAAVVVTQERFSLSLPREQDDSKWFVGLTYTTEKSGDFDQLTPAVWLKPTDERKVIPVPADSGWILFNVQSTGLYRVNYDEKNWKLLLIQLITKPEAIHALNRAQIVDDAHHLSRAGAVPYDYYISLLEYLLMEDQVTPWVSAVDGLSSTMNAMRRYPAEYLKFREYAKGLAGILYEKLARGEIRDHESTKAVRSRLFAWTCETDHSRCEETASRYFDAWRKTGQSVPPEMEEAAFCTGMRKGDFSAWSKMYKFYRTTRSPSYKKLAVRALACVQNVRTLFNRLSLLRLDGANAVSAQNFKTVCENIATTPQGVGALADFVLRKLDAIAALEDGHRLVSFAYAVLARKVATDDEIATMNKIRRSAKSAALRAALDKEHAKIESNLQWMERDLNEIVRAIGK